MSFHRVCAVLLFIWSCIQHADARALLRGVATNKWDGGCNDLLLLNRMSWYYNWATKPETNVINCTLPNSRHVEYVPMIWGRGAVVDNKGNSLDIIKNLPTKGTFSALMAFNEPNFREQSNLLPKDAADLWKQVQTQLITAGIYDTIQIGAPSASPGGTLVGYSDPVVWLQQFFGNCSTCRFDFQNWHIYDCNGQYFDAGGFNYWIGRGKSLGRPLWLTEFDCPNPPNEDKELQWMNAVLPSLDSDVNVARYSWFTARPGDEQPTVGIINALLTPINQPQALTAIGNRYNNAGDCLMKNDGIISVDVNCTITMGPTTIIIPINNTDTNNNNNKPTTAPTVPNSNNNNPTTTPTIPNNNNNNNNNNNITNPTNSAHSISSLVARMMVCVTVIVLTLV